MITLDLTYNKEGQFYTITVASSDTSVASQNKMDAILQCLLDRRAPRRGGFVASEKGIVIRADIADVESLTPDPSLQKQENEV